MAGVKSSLQQQLVVVGLQHAATLHDEAQTTIRPPYRGRITGPIRFAINCSQPGNWKRKKPVL